MNHDKKLTIIKLLVERAFFQYVLNIRNVFVNLFNDVMTIVISIYKLGLFILLAFLQVLVLPMMVLLFPVILPIYALIKVFREYKTAYIMFESPQKENPKQKGKKCQK